MPAIPQPGMGIDAAASLAAAVVAARCGHCPPGAPGDPRLPWATAGHLLMSIGRLREVASGERLFPSIAHGFLATFARWCVGRE